MKKTLLGILMILVVHSLVWAAPGDVTPVSKAFVNYSGPGGKAKPTTFNDTLKFTGNVSVNASTKTVSIPLQTTITGNSGTATALAANGTNCSSGQAALGVDASGNAEGCWTPAGAYSLPTATSSILGGVKPDGTSILNTAGVLSVTAASVGALASSGTAADSDKLDGQHGSYYQTALGYTPMKTDYSNAGTAPTWNQNTSGTAAGLSGTPSITVSGLTADTNTISVDTTNHRTGFGTTSPAQRIDVYSASSSDTDLKYNAVIRSSDAYSTTPKAGIAFATYFNGTQNLPLSGIYGGKENNTSGDFGSTVCLATRPNGGNLTDRVCASSTGAVSINKGTNIIYYCNGGANAGLLGRGNGGPCSGGSWVATSLRLD